MDKQGAKSFLKFPLLFSAYVFDSYKFLSDLIGTIQEHNENYRPNFGTTFWSELTILKVEAGK